MGSKADNEAAAILANARTEVEKLLEEARAEGERIKGEAATEAARVKLQADDYLRMAEQRAEALLSGKSTPPLADGTQVVLAAPKGVSAVSVQGVQVEVENGFVRVERWVANHLKEAFGFKEV